MTKNKSYYICTTPLQYFNATNIHDVNYKVCIINTSFNQGGFFFNQVELKSTYWKEVISVDNWKDAYKILLDNKASIENLYIDSDSGLQINYYLYKLSNINIFVYEEGIGNYRIFGEKSFTPKNLIISTLNKAIGNKSYLGGSRFTNGVYIYNTSKFSESLNNPKVPILKFNKSFLEHLNEHPEKDLFLSDKVRTFIETLAGRKVVLYLTAWSASESICQIMNNYPNYYKILKPHPHFKSEMEQFENTFDKILTDFVFLEAFIYELSRHVEILTVIHHNSSALMYLNDVNNIKSVII